MEIKFHNVKKQKKEHKGRNRDVAETFVSLPELCNSIAHLLFLRKGDLKMSQEHNLLESIPWRIICRLESGQTQLSAAEAIGVVRSVIARLWNQFHESGNVRV